MRFLDTNTVAAIINGEPAAVRARFKAALADGGIVAISSIVLFELHYGVSNSTRQRENSERLRLFVSSGVTLMPFDDGDARSAGTIRANLNAKGTPIGPYDVLIAGQALRNSATLVTANTREFQRVDTLMIEDWSKRSTPPKGR